MTTRASVSRRAPPSRQVRTSLEAERRWASWGAEPDLQAGVVLLAMIACYTVVFGRLSWRNQSLYFTTGFDIGIHDQAIWLAAHGKPLFDTVRGLNYFAENVNLISLAFVPFYWLGAGPHFLIVANTLALGSGAVPLWLIGRDRFDSPLLALIPAGCYLLYPTTGYLDWWGFHPDTFAIPPLLFAWWFATRRRWVGFAISVVVAMSCKEDAALAVVGMGIAVAFWSGGLIGATGRRPRRRSRRGRWRQAFTSPDGRRQAGLLGALAGLIWFEICTKVILPGNNAGLPPFYSSYFPALGSTPPQVIGNALRHPSRVLTLARLPTRKTYYVEMFAPVGFLFFLALPAFLVAAPQFGINIVDQGELGATITSQYSTLVVVGVFLATVEALGVIYRRTPVLLRAACALLIFTTGASTVAWGISPLGVHYHSWWPARNAQRAEITHALHLLPATAGVAVSYNLTPHVTHRVVAYEFPNPWVNVNWLSTTVPERPSTVGWIIVEEDLLSPADQQLLKRLTSAGGAFRVVYEDEGVLAARRR